MIQGSHGEHRYEYIVINSSSAQLPWKYFSLVQPPLILPLGMIRNENAVSVHGIIVPHDGDGLWSNPVRTQI